MNQSLVSMFLELHTDVHFLANGSLTAVRYGNKILVTVRSYAVAVALGSPWCRKTPSITCQERVGLSWVTKALMPLSEHHVPQT